MSLLQKSAEERAKLLALSWSKVATGYNRELVPRFNPWTQTTLLLLAGQELPPGNIWVPACGPGQELEPVAAAFPANTVIGADLAPDMVGVAQQMIAASPHRERMAAEVADCSAVPERLRPLAGVFSCFGLQMMLSASATLLNWYQALHPGGVAAVIFWPASMRQTDDAWNALTDTVIMKDQVAPAPAPLDWEAGVPDAAVEAGAILLMDERRAFPMEFESAAHFFEVMVESGPLQLRLLAMGPDRMAAQKQAFVNRFGGAKGPFIVRPTARTVVLQKPRDARL